MLIEDKVAVINGSGGQIGGAVARAFAREGTHVGFKVALDALEGLRQQWACELGAYGIRVVTIKTGGILESLDLSVQDREAIISSIEQGTLLKRAATLVHVGNIAAFLASDLANTLVRS